LPRITKVYTRQGDRGETRLVGGQTLPKDDVRIEAYGTVDELGATLGVVLALGDELVGERCREMLTRIQNDLFHMGSMLATHEDDRERFPGPSIEARHVETLEGWIDEVNGALPPLENFVLPGGTEAAARLHVARCVCRRAERRTVTLAHEAGDAGAGSTAMAVTYLNRLSDLLFVLSRDENHRTGTPEVLWDSRA
jgi:cob(I)alamin adenosyltransferase